MSNNPRLYFYKLTTDNNGAPFVDKIGDLLSLSICKPMIRKTAKEEDLIFGFAATSLDQDNRLIYISRISEKQINGNYYKDEQFSAREDCIYEWNGDRFLQRSNALHHKEEGNLVHDIGMHPNYRRSNVLLSNDFRYFGKENSCDYKILFPSVGQAIENLGIGHRVNHEANLKRELLELQKHVWENWTKKAIGKSTSSVHSGICHRINTCGMTST